MKILTHDQIVQLAEDILKPKDINSLIKFVKKLPKSQWLTGTLYESIYEKGKYIGIGYCFYGFFDSMPEQIRGVRKYIPARYEKFPMALVNDGLPLSRASSCHKDNPKEMKQIFEMIQQIKHPKDRVLAALKYMRDHP